MRPHRKKWLMVGGQIEWWCVGCDRYLPAPCFYADRRARAGVKSECRKCHSRTSIRSRDQETSRRNNRKYMRAARGRDPEKFRARERIASRQRQKNHKTQARAELNQAVARGDIIRAPACERCGRIGKVNGHHDDYAKPFDVEWVCSLCHGIEHRRKP